MPKRFPNFLVSNINIIDELPWHPSVTDSYKIKTLIEFNPILTCGNLGSLIGIADSTIYLTIEFLKKLEKSYYEKVIRL